MIVGSPAGRPHHADATATMTATTPTMTATTVRTTSHRVIPSILRVSFATSALRTWASPASPHLSWKEKLLAPKGSANDRVLRSAVVLSAKLVVQHLLYVVPLRCVPHPRDARGQTLADPGAEGFVTRDVG